MSSVASPEGAHGYFIVNRAYARLGFLRRAPHGGTPGRHEEASRTRGASAPRYGSADSLGVGGRNGGGGDPAVARRSRVGRSRSVLGASGILPGGVIQSGQARGSGVRIHGNRAQRELPGG